MKKIRVIAITSLLFATVISFGQDKVNFFPSEAGVLMKYVEYDKKDLVTGGRTILYLGKDHSGEMWRGKFRIKLVDELGQEYYERSYKVDCDGESFFFEPGSLLNLATMSAYDDMDLRIKGESCPLSLNAAPGTRLDDCSVIAEAFSGDTKIITISVELSDRIIEGTEVLETPVGSLECSKYSYHSHSMVGLVEVEFDITRWLHPVYGWIREEKRDKRGKLQSTLKLEAVTSEP